MVTSTSKIGAVGLLCASLMNKGKTTLRHVPRIDEVHRIIEVLQSIGMRVEWHGSDVTLTPPKVFALKKIDVAAAPVRKAVLLILWLRTSL